MDAFLRVGCSRLCQSCGGVGLVSSDDALDVVQRLQGCGISMLTVPLNAATRESTSVQCGVCDTHIRSSQISIKQT